MKPVPKFGYKDGILAYFSDMKEYTPKRVTDAYAELCQQRRAHQLSEKARWFEHHLTYFQDNNHRPFLRHMRKIYESFERL